MELPQPRPFGTQGRKTTHDFLPLYSSVEQDPRPPQGGHLKTHDFLQLERAGKSSLAKEETTVEIEAVEKSPSVEHILPGGIGTYSISYVQHQRAVPKPDAPETSIHRNDENSNGSAYTGSGFTLWDECVVNKGKTGKENIAGDRRVLREAGMNSGGGQRWPSQSSSDHKHNMAALSSLSSAQKSPSPALKNQSFLHMITSAKNAQEYDDDDDEEEFVIKKEPQLHPRGSLSVQFDGKSSDQKPNTPRSKHSATEQRRRSKINDRFQMLREFIPHSDQKRDKASFLLEVIEYIRFLQEKVHKFEGSYQGWDNEPSKLPRSKCHRTTQGIFDHAQGASSASSAEVVYAGKLDENKMRIPSTNPINVNKPETDISTSSVKKSSPQRDLTNKETTTLSMQPSANCASSSIVGQHSSMLTADTDQLELKSQPQFWFSRSHMTDAVANAKLRGQELSIESGTISFSSVYSQGLLNTLTQALQNSGVDLSQASISMKIDIGKTANGSRPAVKGEHVYTSNQPIPQSIVTSTGESSDRALKRLKTSQT